MFPWSFSPSVRQRNEKYCTNGGRDYRGLGGVITLSGRNAFKTWRISTGIVLKF